MPDPQMNPLMPSSPQASPGQGLGMQPPGAGGGAMDTLGVLAHQHEAASAQYAKLKEVMAKSDAVRQELATLAKLGDMVSPEDVIKGASKLVGAGLDPHMLASLLADMPTNGGPALAAWVATHEQGASEAEAQVAPQLAQARHALGLSALRVMSAAHPTMSGGAPQQSAQPPAPDMMGSA